MTQPMPHRALPRLRKVGVLALLLLALTACANGFKPAACNPTARRGEEHETVRRIAADTLQAQGMTPTTIRVATRFASLARPGNGRDEIIRGYAAWARVRQCEVGLAVVLLNTLCQITDVHTRHGCRVDGVASYW